MRKYSTPYLHESWIQKDALDVVSRLKNKKHTCYLVGGCVRDLLIGINPKDFDIGTSATPQEIKRNVPFSYIIGKRFRLVLVRRGEHLFEVATFRKTVPPAVNSRLLEDIEGESSEDQQLKENSEASRGELIQDVELDVVTDDNVFGSPEEDAFRRDFTVNGLFYDPFEHKIVDYVDGMKDLEACEIKMIGDPETRFLEDSIRILRAIRLAHKIHFTMDQPLMKAIEVTAVSLSDAPLPRKREEILKFLKLEDPSLAFLTCLDTNTLKYLSPTLHKLFDNKRLKQEFLCRLRYFNDTALDLSKPLHLMCLFVFHFLETIYTTEEINNLTLDGLSNDDTLIQIFRFEIGVFKLELDIAYKAFLNIKKLNDLDKIKNKEDKKIVDVLKYETFYLSFLLGVESLRISLEAQDFWCEKYQKHIREVIELDAKKVEKKHKRKRKRYKR
ncbi:MAG: hypothetical protein HOO06_16845 [Bdellovibrionaceae bacterium]|jgi:poly(A) polymerase|nr:hypothetical protein [Pseudobdellovibrionaceae bacterium]